MYYEPLRDTLKKGGTVILDGAIGTEILRRNVSWADHQVASQPEFVRRIHEDYIMAGADVISTNSFQLTRRAFCNHFRDDAHRLHIGARDLDDRANLMLAASVRLAIEARERVAAKRPVAVAAAITTLEWCFRPDLVPAAEKARAEYRELFGIAKKNGADLILFETVNSIGEANVAAEVAAELKLPCWVGFVPASTGKLFTGETLGDAVEAMQKRNVDAVLVNCAPPVHISTALKELVPRATVSTGAYAHIGRFNPPEWLFTDEYPPDRYAEVCAGWKKSGARVLGGCCGTTPDHIAALQSLR